MKIGFVGLGKLVLPVALAVESKGHEVVGYDISDKVKNIIEAMLKSVKNHCTMTKLRA